MDKVKFLQRLEAAKSELPVGVVPLYLNTWPDSKESRVRNTMAGKIQDEAILKNLEKLVQTLKNLQK